MKSEHRHELKTNELADWIVNFPQWFAKNQTTIIVGTVLVIGLAAYTIFFYSRQDKVWEQKNETATGLLEQLAWQRETAIEGQTQGLNVSDYFINTASALEAAALETDNPVLSALEMIKRAEALRSELDYRQKPAEPDVRKHQLEQAKSIYEQALATTKDSPAVAAMAEYGIALCLEDMGDFNGAKNLYEKISGSAQYQGTSFAARAEFRAKTMDEYKKKPLFVGVKTPKQATEPNNAPPAYGPLKLEEPMTPKDTASQKQSDSNLTK